MADCERRRTPSHARIWVWFFINEDQERSEQSEDCKGKEDSEVSQKIDQASADNSAQRHTQAGSTGSSGNCFSPLVRVYLNKEGSKGGESESGGEAFENPGDNAGEQEEKTVVVRKEVAEGVEEKGEGKYEQCTLGSCPPAAMSIEGVSVNSRAKHVSQTIRSYGNSGRSETDMSALEFDRQDGGRERILEDSEQPDEHDG